MPELLVSDTINRLTPERLANFARVSRSQADVDIPVIASAPKLF